MNVRTCGYLLALFTVFARQSTDAYCLTGTEWFVRSVPIRINATSGPTGAGTAIQSAMATWSDVTCSDFQFTYAGSTTSFAGYQDYYNVCSFGYVDADGTIAEATTWSVPSTGQIVEGDIEFNTYYLWSTTGAAGKHDVQNIATHELGHVLGLCDLYGGADTEKTLYGYAATGETKKRSLDPDDSAGLCYLYPSSSIPLATALDYSGTVTTGSSPWYGQTAVTHDGVDAGQSADIGDSGESYCYITVTGPGTINFWWKVSSESTYDKLVFYDGTTELARISGQPASWAQPSFSIGSGSHQLKWTYVKDGSLSSGSDAGWVDQVVWTPGPSTYTISGYVRTSGGSGISGVTMNGLPGPPVSSSSGYYTASVSSGWYGTVTPSKTCYAFSPTSLTYNNVTANQTSQNYTGTLLTYTIATSSSPSGGGLTAGGGSHGCGSSATVTATSNTGFGFVNWTENDIPISTSTDYTFTVAGSRTLVANFVLLPDVLDVTPADGMVPSGSQGGPFNPSNKVYTLCNRGTDMLDWSATYTRAWIPVLTNTLPDAVRVIVVNSPQNCRFFRVVAVTGGVQPVINEPTYVAGQFQFTLSGEADATYIIEASTSLEGEAWVTVEPPGGSLAPGACTNVTVLINSNALNLSIGVHTTTVAFHNLMSGATQTRAVQLTVRNPASSIMVQPSNQEVLVGGTATFSISATGTSPLSYFWRRNGTDIIGATASSHTITNVQLVDSGSQFSCLVSNAYGTALSSNAVLTVSPPSSTNTFNYSGAVQTYTVPDFVTSIVVDAYGSQGGGPNGGLGGRATATIPVTPGSTLYIYVGGQPTIRPGVGSGGFNGGGAVNALPCGGGSDGWGGGGASDIRTSVSLSSRIIVAGGGGGEGYSSGGGGAGGGLTGGDGAPSWISGAQGRGGTQSVGGAGGYYDGDPTWTGSGSLGQGGDAGPLDGLCIGGGGGGGFYGGGGGYCSPGGGGSSYVSLPGSTNTSTIAGVRSGNGQIVIITLQFTNAPPGPAITGRTTQVRKL